MPTPAERQALAFLATVALLGSGVRVVQGRAFERSLAAEEVLADGGDRAEQSVAAAALARQLDAVEHKRSSGKSTTKRKAGGPPAEPINVDIASATELEALPRIGPALAKRIVADREENGPFGSLEVLERVKGVGPALARGIEPHVTFSPGLRPFHGGSGGPARRSP